MIREVLATYAALLFSRRPAVGGLVLLASFVAPPAGLAGLFAVVVANRFVRWLRYPEELVVSGYYGYSAALLGIGLGSSFPLGARLVVLVLIGVAVVVIATAILGDILYRYLRLPTLALPFCIFASLLLPSHTPYRAAPWFGVELALPAPLDGALRAMGAVVFSPTIAAGSLIALALLISSRIAFLFALAGLVVANAFMLALQRPHAELAMGYNAALAAVAIGAVYSIPSCAGLVVSSGAATASAWVAAELARPFAWPFTVVSLVVLRGLHLRSPGHAPFPSLAPGEPPERNLELAATQDRVDAPGPPRLALPFYGTWAVTQGTDGAHTHQGPWAHALDFEALDEEGFPFRGDGQRLEDYRCFGLPLLAPVSGIVEAVYDGVPDNLPGELDTERPWGNAVVLAFAPDLYCVLAHLRCGSAAVSVGQHVVVGQLLGSCGASGRSPRPHLHLQVQRTRDLGARAIEFSLANYISDDRRYVERGVPKEQERVRSAESSPLIDSFAMLPIGSETELELEPSGRLRFRSEVEIDGERFLRDIDRGDRLYFLYRHGCLVFTEHRGARNAPLRTLLYAMPRLPSATGWVELVDRPVPSMFLGWLTRGLHDVIRVISDPLEVRTEISIREQHDSVIVTTMTNVGLRGRSRPRYRGRVELDAKGLRALELSDERRSNAVVIRARRKS
jgi:urea transporter